MKTKDGREYKPGMTLYFAHDGIVEERKTRTETDRLPEYALAWTIGYVSIQTHYGFRDGAYVEATNHWLHIIRAAEASLQNLNRERNAGL